MLKARKLRVLTLNVDLSSELEKVVESKLRSGRYDSVNEVLREALQLLERRDRILTARTDEYRRQIEDGWLAARRGDLVSGDEVFDRIDSELEAAELSVGESSVGR
jgi:antitoxin ParD1/3/4